MRLKITSYFSNKDSFFLLCFAFLISMISIFYYLQKGTILAYGDAESHINIAKRVIDSITPGLAQLGGIWLPLPHLLMVPFVDIDVLWRTGLAGSIVSSAAYIVSGLYLFKLTHLITKKKRIALIAFLLFALNPNILYMQATPMTELPLIAFFMLSTYYFVKFIKNYFNATSLILAAFFAFCASLTRYDGWLLVLTEAAVIMMLYMNKPHSRKTLEGRFILFSSLAFFGIGLWVLWNYLILGNPFYFTNSPFSAKSQQQNWLARGELPAYHNLFQAFVYYTVTAMENVGKMPFVQAILGLFVFLYDRRQKASGLIALVLLVPFIFYIITLYIGQSVIFIPGVTPQDFEWNLFNVRYGIMMVPAAAFFVAFLIHRVHVVLKFVIIGLILTQYAFFFTGNITPITLADGTSGLSSSKKPDAETWLKNNYDKGLVLLDDYARTVSIVRSGIPMENVIYIGNKPYWEDSLKTPEKHATWIVMQQNDAVWSSVYADPKVQGRLFTYFKKVYTSPNILIFRRNY